MSLLNILWPFLFLFAIAGATVVIYNNKYNIADYNAHQYVNSDLIPVPKKEMEVLKGVQIPTVNQEQCLLNEYCNCPRYNGSYEQCTNNYIPSPNQNHCDCNNRNFELCPWPFKTFESWYREAANKLPSRPTSDNFRTIPHHPADELYMDVKELTESDVPPKEKGPFAVPPANVRAF